MATPAPQENVRRAPVEVEVTPASVTDAMWRHLSEGVTAPWLEEIRGLRTDTDDVETSLDIWSVALIAALKDPARRQTASLLLTRLSKLDDDENGGA